MPRRRSALVASLVLVAGVVWAADASAASPRVRITPGTSRADEPLHIVGSGFTKRRVVSLTIASVDARGVPWTGAAGVRTDAHGRFDLTRDEPVTGNYQGRWGTGLLVTMRPAAGASLPYFWPVGASRFTLSVRDGSRTTTTTFRRSLLSRPVTAVAPALAVDGFVGDYLAPTTGARHQAVMMIGGSEGGRAGPLARSLLAERGYPTLSVAYFKAPGLPDELADIPLEYFERALRWLQARPEVAGHGVTVVGASRGSEAALLLGVHDPQRVDAVVATVPSSVAICGYPDCSRPAWTLHGKAIPFTRQFDTVTPMDDPAAVIPVEGVRGPILTSCAGLDLTWHSCDYARAIAGRLKAHRHPFRDDLRAYPQAGHFVGASVPYEPIATAPAQWADEHGREDFWPRLLKFLAQAAAS